MSTILVIEDEPQVRANLCEILELQDFYFLAAENGRIGIQLARDQQPDLIICDVMMPEMDGYEVLEQLRQYPETATIPLIFLTARAERSDQRRGMQLGAEDYLTKPFSPDELLGAIATQLTKRATLTQHYTSEIEKASARLHYLARHDSLTGLPNHLLLQERFCRIQPQANLQNPILLLILSIDQFSRVNSTLGHVSGSSLLQAIAERLMGYVSRDTKPTILLTAHLGGDRFGILLQNCTDEMALNTIFQHLSTTLSAPFLLNNHEIFITPSVGVADYPTHAHDLHSLLACAEGAMLNARTNGGNQYQRYTDIMTASSPQRLGLETDLHYALERNELRVYYQPCLDLKTQLVVGAEALVRWEHPQYGFISPAEFIPIAEETGLIIPIGEWVLRTACQQAQEWQDQYQRSLNIGVNLSALQFRQPNLTQRIIHILATTGLKPACLTVELTESLVMQDVENANRIMVELKALGIKIAIDDFGTGYSSLTYLRKFPFDTLKIDQCFVRDITNNPGNIAITAAIIQMARGLHLSLVGEGIETEAELQFLRHHHCEVGQGYLFSPPVPNDAFTKWLSNPTTFTSQPPEAT